MSDIHIVSEYPYPPATVWRALTDPALMERWMIAARPEGFSTAVGARFKFVGPPQPGWSGIVECEVLESREPSLLRYSWVADGGDRTQITYRVEPHGRGARFTFEHTGFTGVGGFLLAKLVMPRIRKKMFGPRISAVLDEIGDERKPRSESTSILRLAPIAALPLALIVAPSSADEPAPRAPITIKLSSLRTAKGKVGCGLYDSARGFPQDAAAVRQHRWCPVDGAASTCVFEPVPRGTYAVACIHDENDNGKLDTNWLGIPTEGVVASNHAKGMFGPPSFADASFTFPGTPTELALTMKY